MNYKNGLLHPYGCLFIRPSVRQHETNLLHWMSFYEICCKYFSKICRENSTIIKTWKKTKDTLHL